MFAQLRSRQISFAFLAVLLALSTLLLITSITWARPAGTIIVNPGDSIQAAINSATPGDTIVINAGTYTESLTLDKAVSLTGVNSATVIIHAVTNQRVITVTGSAITITTIISNLTLTNGNVNDKGGGMWLTNGAEPFIQSVVIANNYAYYYGGGIYADSGSPLTAVDAQIFSNTAGYYGGGIGSQDTLTLVGGRFENNQADSGGGIWGPNAALTLTNVLFVSNTARFGGGGGVGAWGPVNVIGGRFENNMAKLNGPGGGIQTQVLIISGTVFVANTVDARTNGGGAIAYDTAIVTNSLFEQNRAIEGNGGGLSANNLILVNTVFLSNTATPDLVGGEGQGGGVFAGTALLSGNHFEANTASMGGALFASGAHTLSNNKFISNFASDKGGGLYSKNNLVLSNTMFVDNTAREGGGLAQEGWYGERPSAYIANAVFARNRTNENGAALNLFSGGNATILHTTIADDGLNTGQAVVVSRATIAGFTNTIIASHTAGIVQDGGIVYQDYNLFFGNTTNLSGTISGGTHDVFDNPHFVDPANDDYHIAPPSAAIDAGVDAGVYTDLDGNVRPSGGGFDIGAYEAAIATVPITGLNATNSSPTAFGHPTTLTATIEAGDLVSYRWDFGDGSALDHYQTVAHTYPSTGIYTAIVTASNSLSTVTATTNITVYVTPITGLVAINSSPNVLNQPTAFTATIAAGDLVSYTWNFGDGSSTGTGITSTHTYSTVGVYTATVTAINSVNAMTATTRVTITDVPLSGLSASNSSPSAIGGATTLTATIGAGSHVTYTWNFGDGSPAVLGQVVTHTYPLSVTTHFTATVAATNSINTQAATTMVIIVPKRVCLPVLIR